MHYLDNAATTRVSDAAADAADRVLRQHFANPSSLYRIGALAEDVIETAREDVADSLGAKPSEIVFTGSGTEGDNMAIFGACHARRAWADHIVVTGYEHPAVQNAVSALEKDGWRVSVIAPDETGHVDGAAIAAAVTGTFSLVDATADFLFSFFGGILMGIALGYLGNFLVRKVRSWGLENTTFHVLFEVFTPFIVYLVANALHTSGILAVVAAGLVNVISPRIIGPSISRMNIVSTSVWRVLSFALNGVVFVLLGTQLPLAFQGTWESTAVSNDKLIAYVLGLAFIVIFARFVWVMAMEWVHSRAERADRPFGLENVRTAAVMTLGGPKGAITLAVAFTISYAVPQRDLMIFMACGVIVVTLLLATFVVPLLAPKKPPTDEDLRCDETEVSIEILRTVIEDLAARQTAENRAATQMVIRSYNDRIARIKSRNDIEDEPNTALRLQAVRWEQELTLKLIDDEEIHPIIGYQYLSRLARIENMLKHHRGRWSAQNFMLRLRAIARSGWHRIVAGLPGINVTERVQAIRDLQMQCAEHVVERLQQKLASPESDEPAEDVSTLLLEYQRSITALRNANPSITALTNTASKAQDIERYGLRLELEQIQARYEDGDLCRSSYKRLRENVALMQVDLEDNV